MSARRPGGAPLRVVIVTLDNHLASAVERAEASLQSEMPGLAVRLHATASWGEDPTARARGLADIAAGDIVIATMLFMEDHIQAVLPALAARRADCDAMLAFMSAGEVIRLTKIGALDMGTPEKGLLALLKRLKGTKKQAVSSASSGARQMAMLRRIPRLLRFIPGTAQDLRAYFLAMQYWLAGSDDNVANMVRLLVDRYAGGERRALRGRLEVAPPAEYADVGLYHPALPGRIAEDRAALPVPHPGGGTVGLLVMRSYVLASNTAHYDTVIAALEARGLNVVPAFAAGLDARPAIERYFFRDGRPGIDCLVSLTGFSLVGGPAYNDASAAEEVLARLDVPYLAAHAVEFQTLAQWRASERGLLPVEATMMVAIPELDGATGPMVFGGRGSAQGTRDMEGEPERAAMLAARVAKLVRLRRTPPAERKIAVVLFSFPPNAGAVGTAAYLSVYASLMNTLRGLRGEGYDVGDLPADADALRAHILGGNAAQYGMCANVHAHIPADVHVRRERFLPEIERVWGPAPGRQQSDGRHILVLGRRFGNVLVGIQPAFGYEGDPMRLLFEKGFAPTHAFAAFYRYLREDFGADAVLHFGTHGALEFMPGQQTALSAACWPDRLIGDLPNVYLYAGNNPSEGSIAKRLAAATLVSYLTPAVTQAGLYRGLLDLKASIERWRALPLEAAAESEKLAELIRAQSSDLDLPSVTIPDLITALAELEEALIPDGLHVVGEGMGADARANLIAAMAEGSGAKDLAATDVQLATDTELPAILRALAGRFIAPAPSGDLIRNPAILPTGRNLHGFDPFRMPSTFAVRDGAEQAERLLARHVADGNALPESVAIVLWGTDNLKSEGGPIAQALA